MKPHPKFNKKLSNVIILSFLFPVIILILSSGLFFYFVTKKNMDSELGKRLSTIADLVSLEAKDWGFTTLSPGDEESRTYKTTVAKLERIRSSSGVKKIYIFDSNNLSLADTDESYRIGEKYYNHSLHSNELAEVKDGLSLSSVLFKGVDGNFYKSGFAPIKNRTGKTIGFVGVEGSADFFKSLDSIKNNIVLFMLIGIIVTIFVGIILSEKIVSPIKSLVKATKEIGEGTEKTEIKIKSKDEIGFLSHAILEMNDNITERDNRLKVMMHGIAHEVRNPLGGIELFSGLLKEELKNSGELLQYVSKIENEVKNLKNLVEEFLDFSRAVKPAKTVVDIKSFFEEALLNFANELKEKDIKLTIKVEDEDAVIFDPDQMRRVLLNLIRNAIDATQPHGRIELKYLATEKNWIIDVIDSGKGIDDEVLNKIYEPFFTTKDRGSGLGLSFAKKIITSHDGRISVNSKLGAGTHVTITLPKTYKSVNA